MVEILFRADSFNRDELAVAKKYFQVNTQRSACGAGLVIGRYSVLPYYKELESDIEWGGGRLINSYEEHRYIAGFDYYQDLKDVMPKCFWADDRYRMDFKFPVVVKGETNSKKHQWNTHMYAADRESLNRVIFNLQEDLTIGSQRIVIKEYVPLVTHEVGINGVRFTEEFRLFYAYGVLLAQGYYWTEAENIDRILPGEGLRFANKIAARVAKRTNFFVLDVALAESGEWILIECNDGGMSGLSCIDPDDLYRNLKEIVRG